MGSVGRSRRCRVLNRPVPRDRNSYVYGADLVRFVSAILVAVFHLTWLDESVSTLAWFGWIGVQVFFVISGFVIARSANNARPIKFAQSRFLRLYPAAWICAGIGLIILIFAQDFTIGLVLRFVASLMLFPTGPFLASAYWTLPIEIMFYLLIFCVLLAGKFGKIERIAMYLAFASVAYIAAYSLQCAGLFDDPNLEFDYGWMNLTLLRHGIYFAFGIFMWLWSEGRLSRAGAATWGLVTIAAVFEITCRSAEIVALMPVRLDLWTVWPIPVAVWLVCCAAIAASAFWRSEIMHAPPMFLRAARIAGLVTYPFYLLHEELGKVVRDALLRQGVPMLPSVGAAVLAAACVALLIAQIAEPALRDAIRHNLLRFRVRAPTADWLQGLFRSGGKL